MLSAKDDRPRSRPSDRRQAKALGVARSSIYYKPRPVSAEDLTLMRRIDELHLDYPFAGARMLRDLLRREGVIDRPPACRDADEADGHRGDLSAAEHEQAAPG